MSWKNKAALTSGQQSSAALIYTGPALIMSVEVIPDGTNADAVVTVHDNTAASGTVVAVVMSGNADTSLCHSYPHGKHCSNGIYLTPSGTGTPSGIVNYIPL